MNFNKDEYIRDKINNYYKKKCSNKKKINNYINLKKNDIIYKICGNLANRIYEEFKEKNIKRTLTYSEFFCNYEIFKIHLSNQFKDGITYNNYGNWEVDHILPISSFNLYDIEEAKKCFNYKNLQPLWKEENLKKSNKIL